MASRRIVAGGALALLVATTLVGIWGRLTPGWATAPGPYPGATLFRPDGVLRSSPATVRQPSFGLAAFVTGTDGGLWWSTDRQGWVALGSPPATTVVGDPAAVSWADGRIDVFVRGGDNRLWQQWTSCGGCQWSGWFKPVGDEGTLASPPTATSWGPGRIDVFVRGIDGGVYQRFWDTSAWDGSWLPRGGVTAGRPAAASWGAGRIDLFVTGLDRRLWQSFWDGSGWTGWFQPPGTEQGTLASVPSAAPWNLGLRNRMTVFARGSDGHVYQTTWDGVWAGWVAVGGPQDVIVGGPGVATTLQLEPSVLARGADDRAYRFDPATAVLTYTYSIAVTGQVRSDVDQFAAQVAAAYADLRGWSLGGQITFVRVPSGGDFTVWLASAQQLPGFSSGCSPTLSCRAGRNVIINDDRWSFGSLAPWPGSLDDFRTFEINHETGHWLGLPHPCMGGPCAPPGQLAPVMMQQPKGLFGDLPNWWPLPSELGTVAAARGLSGAVGHFAARPFPQPTSGVDSG
ncbi:MAG: DUF3152 domain-containing protein [Actinomycetota bacterium]|nr:DUF3152 domain-containing protein [Actinomycetota bacterium]